jgi:hypothetical protein
MQDHAGPSDVDGRVAMLTLPNDVRWWVWLSAIIEFVGVQWPQLLPTPGRARFNAAPGAPILLAISIATALWLSYPRWHTRQRMIRFAWIVGPIGLVAWQALGLGTFGLPLDWAALGVWRAIRRERASGELPACA